MKFLARNFSIEEANALLPELEAILLRLDGKKQVCDRLHDMLLMDDLLKEAERSRGAAAESGNEPQEEEAKQLDGSAAEIQDEIKKIRLLGCIPRNLEKGWIDFPAKVNGRKVYFCWRRGEQNIGFYSLDISDSGRLPLA